MEEFPGKELNEIELSKLSDIEFKKDGYKDAQRTQWQLEGTEWELQQNEKGNRNYKQEPGRNKYNISYKNTLEGITIRLDEAEDQISEL